jgi:hypothetical protein
MDFLKKHYEKLLLGIVLLGFLAAVGFLLFKVNSDKQALEDKRLTLTTKPVKALSNLDLTLPEAALKRVAQPFILNFDAPNRLFNPMPWQQKPDGLLIPTSSVGAANAAVTNITPLYLRLSFEGVTPSDAGARYAIGVQKEASARPGERIKKSTYGPVGTKNDTCTLLSVQGKPDDPAGLVVELNDTGEHGVITKEKPFTRVDGYLASIGRWKDQRVGARIVLDYETYKIVDIKSNEVVLLAESNQKKSSLKLNAPSATP